MGVGPEALVVIRGLEFVFVSESLSLSASGES